MKEIIEGIWNASSLEILIYLSSMLVSLIVVGFVFSKYVNWSSKRSAKKALKEVEEWKKEFRKNN